MLGLKYFLLSQQALALYRQFTKTVRHIPDASTR